MSISYQSPISFGYTAIMKAKLNLCILVKAAVIFLLPGKKLPGKVRWPGFAL